MPHSQLFQDTVAISITSGLNFAAKIDSTFDCNFSKKMFKGTCLLQFKDLVCFGILVNINQKLNIARIADLNQEKN